MFRAVVFDGHEYAFRMDYMGGILRRVLKEGQTRGFYIGAEGHPYRGRWRFNRMIIEQEEYVASLAAGLSEAAGWDVERVRASLNKSLKNVHTDLTAFAWGLTQTIYPISDNEFAVASSAFHGAANEFFRQSQGRWLKNSKVWVVRDISLVMLVNGLNQLGYPDDRILIMDGKYAITGESISTSSKGDIPAISIPANEWFKGAPVQEEKNEDAQEESQDGDQESLIVKVKPLCETGITLETVLAYLPKEKYLEHQVEGAYFAASRTGALIADEMGTGKTRTVIGAAYVARMSTNRSGVLIAAPKSVLYKWKREILAVFPNESVEVFTGDAIPDSSWVITNYERLEKMMRDAGRFGVLIIDEAHVMKEADARRTQYSFDLASLIPIKYLLTATPILNKEAEIHALLRLSGHPLGDLPIKEFVARFAGSREFRRAFNEQIMGNWMIRRLQSQVLKGKIPGKKAFFHAVEMDNKSWKKYQEIMHDSAPPLARIQAARQLIEHAKVPIAKKYLAEMPKDEKLVVFTNHVSTAYEYAEVLSKKNAEFVVVTGSTSDAARDRNMTALQEDDSVRGFVGTYQSCGVGIDLWRANHVFHGCMPWRPADKNQADDRCNRLGQTRLVYSQAPLFVGTIDLDIHAINCEKEIISQQMIDPDEVEKVVVSKIIERVKAMPLTV